ncbi:hypothetical protein FMN50_11825 [Rhodobacterales bacterium]|nr:hypothetical protein FMN50_11825 [Rhodobacterales bacterium]
MLIPTYGDELSRDFVDFDLCNSSKKRQINRKTKFFYRLEKEKSAISSHDHPAKRLFFINKIRYDRILAEDPQNLHS